MKLWRWTLLALALTAALILAVVLARTLMLSSLWKPAVTHELAPSPRIDAQRAALRLGQAIRFPTVSREQGKVDNPDAFRDLRAFLKSTYPRVHRAMTRERIEDLSLLYTLPGSDPSLEPILLLAHQDVVPVESGTEQAWEAPPFAGEIHDGFVYGRGAFDNKGSLIAIFEAMEALLEQGFSPRRTILLAFGHDEEVMGSGAEATARTLQEKGVKPWFVLDEGAVVLQDLPMTGEPAALIGIAEKGYLTVRVTAHGPGGHASMPPSDSATERLSRAILAIRGQPFSGGFDTGPAGLMLQTLAPQLGFLARAVIANRWLFEPLLISGTASTPAGNALLRTTIAPTLLSAGTKPNVIPQEATAFLNLRIHPRDSVDDALEHMRHSVADIEGIEVETYGRFSEPSPISSVDNDAYSLLVAVAGVHAPEGAPVVPALVLAATDSRFYAPIARDVYRFAPVWMPQADLERVHGTGERLSVEDLGRLIGFYAQLIETGAR